MQKIQLIFLFWISACVALPVLGAELKSATSVFEHPSFASRQMEIISPGAALSATGLETRNAEGVWIPIKTAKSSGWIIKSALELTSADLGYQTWPGKEHSVWVWGGVGPTLMSAGEIFTGVRADIGAEWFVNHLRQFFVGFNVTSPFTSEKKTTAFDGKYQRYSTYFNFGYLVLPPKVYVRYGLGLSPLAGANRHLMNKFGASAAGELGYHFITKEDWRMGVSFSYEYTGKSRQSVNFLQDLGHCILGGCDPSEPNASASIFTVNLTFAWAP